MPTGQTQPVPSTAKKGSQLPTTQLDESEPSAHIYTSAKYTKRKLIKQPKFKRSPRPDKDRSKTPTNAVKINDTVVYLFSGPVMDKYDFLDRANVTLRLAVELLNKKDSGKDIEDPEYDFLDSMISKIKLGYQSECAHLPMNHAAKAKYQTAITQLDWALQAIY